MSFTPAQIADAVWTNATRTTDALAPAASNGTVLDDIAYAVWTYSPRTVEGGSGFSFVVAETLQVPSQSATAQTVMPVTVAETLLAPVQSINAQTNMNVVVVENLLAPTQTITAEAVEIFTVNVNQSTPAPSQSITAEATGGTKKKNKPWASYYPPILTIRTNGSQEAPAPGERARAIFNEAPKPEPIVTPVYSAMARQYTPAPIQAGRVKSHREVKAMRREESDILALLASL